MNPNGQVQWVDEPKLPSSSFALVYSDLKNFSFTGLVKTLGLKPGVVDL